MSHETKTFRGPSLEELLPQIRAELGPDAVITRRRDGVVGGVGGFFGRRCVEVEARAGDRPASAPPARALPPRQIFDAYDADRAAAAIRADDLENPVVKALVNGSAPFAEQLQAASEREDAIVFADVHAEADARAAGDAGSGDAPRPSGGFEALDLGDAEEADEEPEAPRRRPSRPSRPSRSTRRADEERAVCEALVELGLPEPVVAALAREIEQNLQPFAPAASYAEQMRRALAGHIRVKYGWRTKQRTIALVGPAGAGKTFTAARLCHAYANGSELEVGTLSVESTADAYRLGSLTDGIDVDIRVADTPPQVERAVARMRDAHLIVVDTPPVSAGDREGIERLAALLDAARVDEVHLVLPAATDIRAARALADALAGKIDIARILVTRLDEVPSAAVAVGTALLLRKPISYVTSGRDAATGLRPADPAELAELVLPRDGDVR